MIHDFRGIERGVKKHADGPADHETKLGSVKMATVMNWTKVINGPALGSFLEL